MRCSEFAPNAGADRPQGTQTVREGAEGCGSLPVAAVCPFQAYAGILALREAMRRHAGLP
jgi:hypothetical protein